MDYVSLDFEYKLSGEECKRILSKKSNSFFEEDNALEERLYELKRSINDSDVEKYDDIYDSMRKIYFRRIEFLKNPIVEKFIEFYWGITNQKAREVINPIPA